MCFLSSLAQMCVKHHVSKKVKIPEISNGFPISRIRKHFPAFSLSSVSIFYKLSGFQGFSFQFTFKQHFFAVSFQLLWTVISPSFSLSVRSSQDCQEKTLKISIYNELENSNILAYVKMVYCMIWNSTRRLCWKKCFRSLQANKILARYKECKQYWPPCQVNKFEIIWVERMAPRWIQYWWFWPQVIFCGGV